MSSDFAWLVEHGPEIDQEYAGKWIAVLNGEIVGIGDTATVAADQAETKHPGADYMLEAVDHDPERL